jgi:outer membrane protein assembly factor BamB
MTDGRRRWSRRRIILVSAAIVLVTGGSAAAWYVHDQLGTHNVEGSSTVEFDTSAAPVGESTVVTTGASAPIPEPFPRYGYDLARTRVVPYDVRPPFRVGWQQKLKLLEFPPVVAYGRLYVSDGRGTFTAFDAATGAIVWQHHFPRCAASSPTVADGVVYQALMDHVCHRHDGARGAIVAMDAATGAVLWTQPGPVVESSLLLVDGLLYYGGWDAHVYAMDASTHRVVWRTAVDDYITDSAAYDRGTVFIGTDGGTLYALDARTGKVRWSGSSFSKFGRREHFYATPAVAFGRVYAPNTDGYVYAFGERTGDLRWARQAGTYVYTAPAIWNRTVYVGTWDGHIVALDAGTGDIRWKFATVSAVSGAPLIVAGVLYYSTLPGSHPDAQRYTKSGPAGTFGLDLRTGKLVWRFPEGRYSPMVADEHHLYLSANRTLAMLEPVVP